MPKKFVLILSLTVIVGTAALTIALNSNSPQPVSKVEFWAAVNQAQSFYNQQKILGEDFSSGPCLTNALTPDWVLDIVHNPRQPIDDLPENQCPAYLEGRARHFVELDPDGNLVRAR